MKLRDVLNLIAQIAKENDLSEPFIVGGVPRDKVLGRLDDLVDLDVSTGDEGSKFVGKELSMRINAPYKLMPDGHSQVLLGNFKIDFSSNFNIPGIDGILKRAGMKNPTDLQLEQYSRDFTCNSLILTIDLKTIKDPLGTGIKDIKNKLIKTCLPASITLGYDNKRVVRVLYLAAKLGFKIDDDITKWIKAHPESIGNATDEYVVKKLNKAFRANESRTIQLMNEMNLWPHVPSVPSISKYMVKAGRV
jgi:tRNA nucleotidyltransferase/poly(A) polymerase